MFQDLINFMPTKREKIELDAAGQSVGRLATQIAMILMGKHKPTYAPHLDNGDKVVIKNVSDVVFTGKKAEEKEYRHHSMYPGGLKTKLAKTFMKTNPGEAVIKAVTKMLPKNKLRTGRLLRISFKK